MNVHISFFSFLRVFHLCFYVLLFFRREAALMSRWEYYEILESAFESTRSGKACLLRIICEAAAVPFRRSHTLTAQLAHIFLT